MNYQARKAPRKSKADRDNNVAASVDLKRLAKNALSPIEKKLKGIYSIGKEKAEKEISTSSLVQMLIEEATDNQNLVKDLIVSPLADSDVVISGKDVSWLGFVALRL